MPPSPTLTISGGRCPWCGAQRTIQSGVVVLGYPPEDCCPARLLWSITIISQGLPSAQADAVEAQDLQRLSRGLRSWLEQQPDPPQALTQVADQVGTWNPAALPGLAEVVATIQSHLRQRKPERGEVRPPAG